MTLENSKRLYAHYMANGMFKEAEDIAGKRPEVKVEEVVEETKSKGKK